ncbi:MAG: hypothetical protein M1814_002305 [Vezdaea aestivalis]|nr:MAG: hypothetical protein M1814_002305 [Vezdaea aestivalis]
MATKKRKIAFANDPLSTRQVAKRSKVQDSRSIKVQASDPAIKDGNLDVDSFIRARQFEIKAFEESSIRAKKSNSTRAHQSLPRDLRRRTASHNVKRVPKRLRARLKRELEVDNTKTIDASCRRPRSSKGWLRARTAKILGVQCKEARIKRRGHGDTDLAEGTAQDGVSLIRPRLSKSKISQNGILANPPLPASKFRRRQRTKTWLPTHLWHSKRARMTTPTKPLWRFSLAITPTEKSYRPTHRASSTRGAIAWDTSYMSTISLAGKFENIISILHSHGLSQLDTLSSFGLRWRAGTRLWSGWLFERDSVVPIAPVEIIWCAEDILLPDARERKLAATSDQSSTQPGSWEGRGLFIRVHPSAFLELWDHLKLTSKLQRPPVAIEDLRYEIGSIEVIGPAAMEALQAALSPAEPEITAPNPHVEAWKAIKGVVDTSVLPPGALLAFNIDDPRLHWPPSRNSETLPQDGKADSLNQVVCQWPPDTTCRPAALFSRRSRLIASRQLSSAKSINRRKGAADPGTFPKGRSTDPLIPLLLLTSRSHAKNHGGKGSWTILAPWKCIKPIWYVLMHCPLSSGGSVRFGGVQEHRQIAFEAGKPWFPGDFPSTNAGWSWEVSERHIVKAEWDRKPKGKRIEWDNVDLGGPETGEIGRGWACDWEYLIRQASDEQYSPTKLIQLSSLAFKLYAKGPHHQTVGTRSLFPIISVKVQLLTRGTAPDRARIYRLPIDNKSLRRSWLALSSPPQPTKNIVRSKRTGPDGNWHEISRTDKSRLLSRKHARLTPDNAEYPKVPGEEDLIGFITRGGYSLTSGVGHGIGSISVDKIILLTNLKERQLCIVREAGQVVGRLAKWETTQ